MIKFNELAISEEILRAIEEMGYEQPTQIQAEAIPLILQGEDVLGKSHTGTGKTAAFGLPAIEKVNPSSKYANVMMICPTRELVMQVSMELRKFSKYKEGIKIVPIYGGQPIDRQIQLLKRGCGIIVGTPGRIMDHLRRKTIRLDDVKMVVLDEADEMLNMGFKEDIEEILSLMPKQHAYQTVLFSATWPEEILEITKQFQKDAKMIEIKSAQRTIDTVEQIYYDVPRGKKNEALRVLLNHYEPELCMIFANTKKMVDELHTYLSSNGLQVCSLHGDMKQEFRSRVMEQFRSKSAPILIASDVAARGIDVDDIDIVINYDIPQDQEYYIHRIGRTGRAGKKGVALTLISGHRQKRDLKDLMKYTKTHIQQHSLPTSAQIMEKNHKRYLQQVIEACNEGVSDESMEIANELLAEGIAVENIISALISMTYKNEVIDLGEEEVHRYAAGYDAVRLKFTIGKQDGVKTGNIVAAISEECSLSSKAIGRIDVRSTFALVDVDATKVDVVLEKMQGASIRGKRVEVEIDQAPKRKSKEQNRKDSNTDQGKSKKEASFKGRKKDRKDHRKTKDHAQGQGRRGRNRKEAKKERKKDKVKKKMK